MREDVRNPDTSAVGLPLRADQRGSLPRILLAVLLVWFSGATTGWVGRILYDGRRQTPPPRRYTVDLVRVVDGDTIKVRWEGQDTSVRLLNINTPERGRPGHREAADHLRNQLAGSAAIELEFEHDGVCARDKFGRLLCYVWLNGKCLNIEQVRAGHSEYWTKYGDGRYPDAFLSAGKVGATDPVPYPREHK